MAKHATKAPREVHGVVVYLPCPSNLSQDRSEGSSIPDTVSGSPRVRAPAWTAPRSVRGRDGRLTFTIRDMAGSGALVLDIETVPDRELWTPPPEGASGERDRSFPPLYACRPVVIGVIWLDDDLSCRRIGVVGEDKTEAEMMADFA